MSGAEDMCEPPQREERPPPGQSTARPIDGLKSELDVLKQITTLNAGSIVVIGTFLKDIFPSTRGAWLTGLIVAAFVLFGISLALSTAVMYAVSDRISVGRRFSTGEARRFLWPPLYLGFLRARLAPYSLRNPALKSFDRLRQQAVRLRPPSSGGLLLHRYAFEP